MTPEVFVWASGLSTLLALSITIWNLVTSGSRSNGKLIASQSKRIDAVEAEQKALKRELEQMPDREMIHRIELSLVELRGEFGQVNERLRPVASIAERMQELMMQQAQGGK